MADRSPQPTLMITEGRVADILAWLVHHAQEINAMPSGELIIGWGGQAQPKVRLVRVETIPPLALDGKVN